MRRKTHGGIKTLGSVLYLRTRSPTPRVQSPRNPPDGPREESERGEDLLEMFSERRFQCVYFKVLEKERRLRRTLLV